MANERKDISELAQKHRKLQTLMQYVNKETLIEEHRKQISGKASGIDQVTKEVYESKLSENIDDLLTRMKRFSYKPQPVRRTYIPKPGSEQRRPLGIPAYEDKLVQGCMTYVLNEIYETKFLDNSYGFRPNRNAHMATRAINQLIMTKRVNYIIDVDIKGFFDNVNHEWLMTFLKHDIEDKNFLRYVVRFLKSGIMEETTYHESDKGTPQGGVISPVLANVYLHYVLDLWFKHMKQQFSGEMYLVRYADDFVILCTYEHEAVKVYEMLKERLAKFNLEISEEKSKIIPFGRFKGDKRDFSFLGFTYKNGKTRTNKYQVKIITDRKKLKIKKRMAKQWLKENMHTTFDKLFKTLNRKLEGHYNYYGVNGNYKSIVLFYEYVKHELYRVLNRRHQKKSMKIVDFIRIWSHYINKPRIKVDIWGWA